MRTEVEQVAEMGAEDTAMVLVGTRNPVGKWSSMPQDGSYCGINGPSHVPRQCEAKLRIQRKKPTTMPISLTVMSNSHKNSKSKPATPLGMATLLTRIPVLQLIGHIGRA